MKKIVIPFFGIILFVFSMSASALAIDVKFGTPENTLYQESVESFGKIYKKYRKAATLKRKLVFINEFRRLKKQYSVDSENLCYRTYETRVLHPGGTYPEYETVEVTKCGKYFPCRILRELKAAANPVPYLKVMTNPSVGTVSCQLSNYGETVLEDVNLTLIKADGNDMLKSLKILEPGDTKSVIFYLPDRSTSFQIKMSEDQNFCINPIFLSLNRDE